MIKIDFKYKLGKYSRIVLCHSCKKTGHNAGECDKIHLKKDYSKILYEIKTFDK